MAETQERDLLEYQTEDGRSPYRDWFTGLSDKKTRARIDARLLRIRQGNFGDAKSVGDGVSEHRIDVGPGYRVYFGVDGPRIVVLLIGGSNATQAKDIERAKTYWDDYQRR